jgi:hypothetical protein
MLTDAEHFMPTVRASLQEVRRALIELYAAAGVDPDKPQEVARRLGINRNLAWKLTKVIQSQGSIAALNYLPGSQGMALALKAFAGEIGQVEAIARVNSALEAFEAVATRHAGDRERLELTLESMGELERDSKAENGRELAFRGNSSVWGVQARLRFSSVFLAPSKDKPGHLDYLGVGGVFGFRRLNPGVRWRLAVSNFHDDKGLPLPGLAGFSEFEEKSPGDTPMLIREFSSPNLPPIEVVKHADGREIVLPAGPVGIVPSFDCCLGYIWRGLPAYRDSNNQYGSTAVPISLPVESLLFDLIVHKDVPLAGRPEALVYGFPHGGAESPTAQTPSNLMNLRQEILELPSRPVTVATAQLPNYTKIANRVYEKMGWNAEEFVGLRLQIAFPPMSTRVVIRWPLPEAPPR